MFGSRLLESSTFFFLMITGGRTKEANRSSGISRMQLQNTAGSYHLCMHIKLLTHKPSLRTESTFGIPNETVESLSSPLTDCLKQCPTWISVFTILEYIVIHIYITSISQCKISEKSDLKWRQALCREKFYRQWPEINELKQDQRNKLTSTNKFLQSPLFKLFLFAPWSQALCFSLLCSGKELANSF